jgi:hypothetical protein
LLSVALPETLDDLTRILRDQVGPIAKLPIHKRRAFAVSYVRTLLGIDITAALENSRPTPRNFEVAPAGAAEEYVQSPTGDHDSAASPLSPKPPVEQPIDLAELGLLS